MTVMSMKMIARNEKWYWWRNNGSTASGETIGDWPFSPVVEPLDGGTVSLPLFLPSHLSPRFLTSRPVNDDKRNVDIVHYDDEIGYSMMTIDDSGLKLRNNVVMKQIFKILMINDEMK